MLDSAKDIAEFINNLSEKTIEFFDINEICDLCKKDQDWADFLEYADFIQTWLQLQAK
jgi:hypothetical protein